MALTERTIYNFEVRTKHPHYHLIIKDKLEVVSNEGAEDESVVATNIDNITLLCGDWEGAQTRGLLLTAQNAWDDTIIARYNEEMATDNPDWVDVPTYSEWSAA